MQREEYRAAANLSASTWLDEIQEANRRFAGRITPAELPVARVPCPYGVITCMDPRVNLEALGISGFTAAGAARSQVRVIRTIGAMSEARSLVIGTFLAGFKEVALIMHSDCGCCLAHARIDTIIENMGERLEPRQLDAMKVRVGEPFRENLRAWLKAFEDPREAVEREIARLRAEPFIPANLVLHGLLYELATGKVEVVIDGYR